ACSGVPQQVKHACASRVRRRPDQKDSLIFVPTLGTIVRVMGTTAVAPTAWTDAAALLFGSTRRRLLGWLLGHADEAYYLRQIARHTGTAVGAVQRELEQLTAAGLLHRTVQGRQVYFQAN